MNNQFENENKKQIIAVCCAPGSGWILFWGILLVLFGILGLLSILLPAAHIGRYILPGLLLVWGTYLLLVARRSQA